MNPVLLCSLPASCTHPLKHFGGLSAGLALACPSCSEDPHPGQSRADFSLTHWPEGDTTLHSLLALLYCCSAWLSCSAAQQHWCRASNREGRAQTTSTKQVLHLFITMRDHFSSLPEGWLLLWTRRESEWERSTNSANTDYLWTLVQKSFLVSKLYLVIYALFCHCLMQRISLMYAFQVPSLSHNFFLLTLVKCAECFR